MSPIRAIIVVEHSIRRPGEAVCYSPQAGHPGKPHIYLCPSTSAGAGSPHGCFVTLTVSPALILRKKAASGRLAVETAGVLVAGSRRLENHGSSLRDVR